MFMPELKCSVITCTHNQSNLCKLDAVQVGGSSAKQPAETCCDSFQEKTEDGYSNAVGEASERCSIRCQATTCDYNESCRCHAGKISVSGTDACRTDETACATFTCNGIA